MNPRLSRATFAGAMGAVGAALPHRAFAADAYTLRMSVTTPPSSVFALGAIEFARRVDQRSNGQVKVEVYPSGQLANEKESIEGLISGVIDLSVQSNAFVVPLAPRIQVIDLPFLVRNLDAGFRMLDGAVGDELFSDLEPKGILGLCWGSGGFKELETTSKAIVSPDDMKGLRFRIQSSSIYVATYQALGSLPVTLDVNETMTALSQHTVDGLDINLDALTVGKYYTVIKHVAMSNHFFTVSPTLASKKKIEAMPVLLQRVVKEQARAVLPYWRSLFTKQLAADMQVLRANGVTFTEIQYPAFRKAVEPVYAANQGRIGADFIDRVVRAVAAATPR